MGVQAVFGGEVVWHSEIDPAASKVLAYRSPDVPNLGDITQVDWDDVPAVDILCGGFPCQDVSAAGRRAGIKDGTRSGLWSIFADAIDALRPQYVVIENVRGLLSAAAHRTGEDSDQSGDMEPVAPVMGNGTGRPVLRAAGAVLGDLADLGYDAVWATVAAADVGAPHRRERVFIVARAADAKGDGWDGRPCDQLSVDAGDLRRVGGQGATAVGDGCGLSAAVRGDEPGAALLATLRNLLPTPTKSDGCGGGRRSLREGNVIADDSLRDAVCSPLPEQWGKYAAAIRRWEQIAGLAPAPTEPNKNGNPRLNAAFSEWMMGWPDGWATDPAIGIRRNEQLKIIGNGVCPQQAEAALRYLLGVEHTHTHTASVLT